MQKIKYIVINLALKMKINVNIIEFKWHSFITPNMIHSILWYIPKITFFNLWNYTTTRIFYSLHMSMYPIYADITTSWATKNHLLQPSLHRGVTLVSWTDCINDILVLLQKIYIYFIIWICLLHIQKKTRKSIRMIFL